MSKNSRYWLLFGVAALGTLVLIDLIGTGANVANNAANAAASIPNNAINLGAQAEQDAQGDVQQLLALPGQLLGGVLSFLSNIFGSSSSNSNDTSQAEDGVSE